jgi:hypothetical protein
MTTFRLKMENTFELLGTKNTAEDGGWTIIKTSSYLFEWCTCTSSWCGSWWTYTVQLPTAWMKFWYSFLTQKWTTSWQMRRNKYLFISPSYSYCSIIYHSWLPGSEGGNKWIEWGCNTSYMVWQQY